MLLLVLQILISNITVTTTTTTTILKNITSTSTTALAAEVIIQPRNVSVCAHIQTHTHPPIHTYKQDIRRQTTYMDILKNDKKYRNSIPLPG